MEEWQRCILRVYPLTIGGRLRTPRPMLLPLLLWSNEANALGRDVYWYSGNSGESPSSLDATAIDFENAVKAEGASKVTYSTT